MKTLEIIAVTYNHGPKLKAFVYSLLSQSSQDYVCRIYHDGPSSDGSREFMERIVTEYPDNFEYIETEERRDVHGHDNRQKALQEVTSPLIYLTNCDNYVIPLMVEAVINAHNSRKDIQVWTFPILHNYFSYSFFPGDSFRLCHTDMCQFVLKREVALAVPFEPSMGRLKASDIKNYWRKKEDSSADGFWIEKIKMRFPNLIKGHISSALAVHN